MLLLVLIMVKQIKIQIRQETLDLQEVALKRFESHMLKGLFKIFDQKFNVSHRLLGEKMDFFFGLFF